MRSNSQHTWPRLLSEISSLAPLTIWAAKEGQRRLNAAEVAIDFDDVIATVYGSADFAEGVRAYLEKRKPTCMVNSRTFSSWLSIHNQLFVRCR